MCKSIGEQDAWCNLFAAIYLSAVKENDQAWLATPLAESIKDFLATRDAEKNRERIGFNIP